MLRAMSTHVYIKRRLHPGLLDSLVRGGPRPLRCLPLADTSTITIKIM